MRSVILIILLFVGLVLQGQVSQKTKTSDTLTSLTAKANKGDVSAMISLANIFYLGEKDIKEDKAVAFEWYLKAANAGSGSAMNTVGVYFENGWVSEEENFEQAALWHQKSAEAGYAKGQFHYAYSLFDGIGIKKDRESAKKWFEKALDGGYKGASFYLGCIYYYGLHSAIPSSYLRYSSDYGTDLNLGDKDYEKAYHYFLMNLEDDRNNSMLGECYRLGRGCGVDNEKALYYYTQATKNNENWKVLLRLGDLYYFGKFLPKDHVKAKDYYNLGLKLNKDVFFQRIKFLFPDFSIYNEKELYDMSIKYMSDCGNRYFEYFEFGSNGIPYESGKSSGVKRLYVTRPSYCRSNIDSLYINGEYYRSVINLSASKNYVPAIAQKAFNLFYGKEGYEENKKEAIKLAIPIANQDKDMANLVATYYEEKKNWKEAFKYYGIAANEKSRYGQWKLSEFYTNGTGVKKNIEKTLQYYRELGLHSRASELCLEYNIKDEKEYRKLINDALSQNKYEDVYVLSKEGTTKGYAYCQFMKAACYNIGWGVEENNSKAVELLYPIKDKDKSYLLLLARVYLDLKREKEGFDIFEELVEEGYTSAYNSLADCYLYGEGVEQNVIKGIELLHESVKKNSNYTDLNSLGFYYLYGIGVDKNGKKAFEYFTKASTHDFFSNSKNNLAICYLKGIGIAENKDKAIEILKSGAMEGNTGAMRNLGKCYLLGDGVKTNYSKAVSYFEKSKKDPLSKLYLAICYELGLGVDRDALKNRTLLTEIESKYLRILPQGNKIIYEYQAVPGYTTDKVTVSTVETNGFLQREMSVYFRDSDQLISPTLSAVPLPSFQFANQDGEPKIGHTPELFVTNYADGDSFSDNDVELSYRLFPSDSRLTKCDIKINEKKIEQSRGFSKLEELSLTLPNEDSRIDIIPYNEYGKGKTTTLYLKWKPKQDSRPNLYVLGIGVDDYDSYSKLKYPVIDMTSFLSSIDKKSRKLYKEINISKLSNEDASIRNIKKELSSLIKQVQEEDLVFIYYAGHGDVHDDQYYFIPTDGEKNDMRSTCLKSSDFMDDVNSIKGKIVLFVDACYSGNLVSSRSGGAEDMMEALSALRKVENDIYIFTSSASKTKSLESDEWEGGLFTKVLVNAFNGEARKNNETILTTERLRQYLLNEMKKLHGDQTPRFSTMPDFPLLNY